MVRNKYPEDTEALILKVASKLFFEKGYENTSVQDIIDQLGGLTKGAVYYHFKSKEEIMLAVIEKLYENHDKEWLFLMKSTELTGLEKLKQMIYASANAPAQFDMFEAAPNLLKNPKLLIEMMRSIMEESAPNYIQPIIEEGIRDGSIKTAYPRELAEIILLLMNLWLTPMVFYERPSIMMNRFNFFKTLLLSLKIDILDEKIEARFRALCDIYSKKQLV